MQAGEAFVRIWQVLQLIECQAANEGTCQICCWTLHELQYTYYIARLSYDQSQGV